MEPGPQPHIYITCYYGVLKLHLAGTESPLPKIKNKNPFTSKNVFHR